MAAPFTVDSLLVSALRKGIITEVELEDEIIRAAAEHSVVAYSDFPDGQGFGSSDMNHAIKGMLDNAGIPCGWPDGKLTRLDKQPEPQPTPQSQPKSEEQIRAEALAEAERIWNEQPEEELSIELDCPPGSPRPADLIEGVLEGSGLTLEDFTYPEAPFFGHMTYKVKKEKEALFKQAQPLFKERVTKLYNSGRIRYGSW